MLLRIVDLFFKLCEKTRIIRKSPFTVRTRTISDRGSDLPGAPGLAEDFSESYSAELARPRSAEATAFFTTASSQTCSAIQVVIYRSRRVCSTFPFSRVTSLLTTSIASERRHRLIRCLMGIKGALFCSRQVRTTYFSKSSRCL